MLSQYDNRPFPNQSSSSVALLRVYKNSEKRVTIETRLRDIEHCATIMARYKYIKINIHHGQ